MAEAFTSLLFLLSYKLFILYACARKGGKGYKSIKVNFMKKIFSIVMFVFASFLITGKASAFLVTADLPLTYGGYTYTKMIAMELKPYSGQTNLVYQWYFENQAMAEKITLALNSPINETTVTYLTGGTYLYVACPVGSDETWVGCSVPVRQTRSSTYVLQIDSMPVCYSDSYFRTSRQAVFVNAGTLCGVGAVTAGQIFYPNMGEYPTISSITPNSVSKIGNSPIVLLGGYFGTSPTVTMCGISATIVSKTDSRIEFLSTSAVFDSCEVVVTSNGYSDKTMIAISDGFVTGTSDMELDYMIVPSLIDDPSGFISVMFHNLGVWLKWLIVPSNEYMTGQLDMLQYDFNTKFVGVTSILTSFSSGFSSLSSAGTTYTGLTVSLYGSAPVPIINTTNVDLVGMMTQLRYWTSLGLWLFCAIYCIGAIRNLLHPGQLKLDV
jgi:hypothetical protein